MKNIEIESKYIIDKNLYKTIENYFKRNGYTYSEEVQHDIYFSPILCPFFGGKIDNESLRIRKVDDKNILNYKKFIGKTDQADSYCIEHEMEIDNVPVFKQILEDLRIEEAFTLIKKRKKYIFDALLEISLDDVTGLGYFIEIELINSEKNIDKAIESRDRLIREFNLKEEMQSYKGYGYMLFEKKEKNNH